MIHNQAELDTALERHETALFHQGVIFHKSQDSRLFPVYHFPPWHQPDMSELARLRDHMAGQGTWVCWLEMHGGNTVKRIGVGFYLDDLGIGESHVFERIDRAARQLKARGV